MLDSIVKQAFRNKHKWDNTAETCHGNFLETFFNVNYKNGEGGGMKIIKYLFRFTPILKSSGHQWKVTIKKILIIILIWDCAEQICMNAIQKEL